MRLYEIAIRTEGVQWENKWRVRAINIDGAMERVREKPEFVALLPRTYGLKISEVP